jgi:glucuronate isomerase
VNGGKFTVRQIIQQSNVRAICTTDDPSTICAAQAAARRQEL